MLTKCLCISLRICLQLKFEYTGNEIPFILGLILLSLDLDITALSPVLFSLGLTFFIIDMDITAHNIVHLLAAWTAAIGHL